MNSIDISKKLGEHNYKWRCLGPKGMEGLPNSKGVYVIRLADGKTVKRLTGDSDILYIGSGKLRNRLGAHLLSRWSFKDKGWLIALIRTKFPLEFGHFANATPRDAESELLGRYFKDHFELPPANRQMPKPSEFMKIILQIPTFTKNQRDQITKLLKEELAKRSMTDDDTPSRCRKEAPLSLLD